MNAPTEITITVSAEDIRSLLNCDTERALTIWRELLTQSSLEDILEEEVMATFNAQVYRHTAKR